MPGPTERPVQVTNTYDIALTDGTRTISPGATDEFPDICSFLRFVRDSNAAVIETANGVVDNFNALGRANNCNVEINGAPMPQAGDNPDESPFEPGESDSAQRLGSSSGSGAAVVASGTPRPADDIRQPTQQLSDPETPRTEGELADAAIEKGATPAEAAEVVDRARKGKPPNGEPDTTHGKERAGETAAGGDPVDLFDGTFYLDAIDLDIPTPFLPLRFERTYRSGAPTWGPFGFNWDHSWNVYLRPLGDGRIARWNGRLHEDVFSAIDGISFEPPRGVFETLEQLAGGVYELAGRGGIVLTFERPPGWGDSERIPLIRMSDRLGHSLVLTYGAGDLLSSVVDDDGRGLFLTNGKCGLVEQVEDHTGRVVDFIHDDDATHLIRVVGPGDRDSPSPYDVSEFEYSLDASHPAMRHNITRVLDGNGDAIVSNSYGDDAGSWTWNRIVEQWQGDDRWCFSYRQVQWLAPLEEHLNEGMWQTDVVEPDGALRVYTFNFRGDLLDERVRLLADGSMRVAVTNRVYDPQGNLSERRVADGAATVWIFDHANPDPRHRGTLLRVMLRPPLGVPAAIRVVQQTSYEAPFQQPFVDIDEAGGRTFYDYDPANGSLVAIRWPDVTLPDGSVEGASTVFELNNDGQVTATTTPEGIRHEIYYDPTPGPGRGFPRRFVHDAAGVADEHTVTFTAEGWLASIADGLGATALFDHDSNGRTSAVTMPSVGGATAAWTYERGPLGLVVAVGRPAGALSGAEGNRILDLVERDPLGRPTAVIVGANTPRPAATSIMVDHRGNIIRERDPSGVLTTRCFDERGLLLTEVADADGSIPLFKRSIHDRGGNAVSVEDRGLRVEHQYDLWGRIVRKVGADGTTVEYTYGVRDRLESTSVVGDPGDGTPARLLRRMYVDHDERDRPIRSRIAVFADDPANATELVSVSWFDRDGRNVRHVGPTGGTTVTSYDGLDRPRAVTDPLGNVIEFDYGVAGTSTTVTLREIGGAIPVVSWVRDDLDARRRKYRTTSSAGSSVQWRYDDRDLVTEVTDAIGTVTRFSHDLWGNVLESVSDAAGRAPVDSYQRDIVGRLLIYRDPADVASSIVHDSFGREREVQIGGVYRCRREYDANGRTTAHDLADGTHVTYVRDSAGRVIQMSVAGPLGAKSVDAHNYRHDGLGRLVEATASGAVLRWRYDSLDRVIAEDGPAGTFLREFDDMNHKVLTRWPTGRIEEAQWDELGRITKIVLSQPDGVVVTGAAGDSLAELKFEGLTKVVALQLGTGAATNRRYDQAGRVVESSVIGADGTEILTRYAYDRAGRRRLDSEQAEPARHRLLSIRPTGELQAWRTGVAPLAATAFDQGSQDAAVVSAGQGFATEVAYELDAAGARTGTTTSAGANQTLTTMTRGPAHRLDAHNQTQVTTDSAGRRLFDGRNRIEYDALGRVVSVVTAAGSDVSFEYDPAGRLSTTTANGVVTHHRYLAGLQLADYDFAGAPIRLRTFHPGLVGAVCETTSAGFFGLHHDHHMDLVATSTANGHLADRYRYDPFGSVSVHDAAGAPRPAPITGIAPVFGAMPRIDGLDLYWTPVRLYDPQTGLFCALDPRGLAGAADPYAYCGHSPVDHNDPTGEIVPLIVIGVMAGVGALLGGGAAWWSGGDVWDIFAGAAIGGVVGGLGGWMFSAAASGATAAIGSWIGGTSLAGTSFGSFLASVGGGALGGLVSGSIGGALSGAGHGAWGAYRGDGDIGVSAWEGAKREALAGGVSGVLTGGMFGGLMRAGVIPAALAPPGTRATTGLTAFRDTTIAAGQQVSRRAAMMPGVLARGSISPWGAGGAAATGFVGGYSGQVTRDLYEGRDVDDALANAWDEGLEGAALNLAGQAAHPVTHRFWNTRLSRQALDEVQARRVGRVALDGTTARHHQRNSVQYPEFAFPVPRQGQVQTVMTRLANAFSRGNVTGPASEYQTRAQHVDWHEMWRTPDIPESLGWTRVPTHGPFTPAWNPYLPRVDADPSATDSPEKTTK